MGLSKSDVQQLARLARLYLNETEEEVIQKELNHMVELIQQLEAIDAECELEEVACFSHQHAGTQALRADVVTESNQRELLQSVAPVAKEGFYIVPKVIE